MRNVVVFPDQQAVADATAARLGVTLTDTIAMRGVAHVVLTGGSVGIGLLASLAASPLARIIDWTSVHVWWGDERFVAAGDAERNEGQAQEALLGAMPLPEDNIHRMPASGEFLSAEAAAEAYADEISANGTPVWDVVMLGMGPDGHVASLFPGHPVFLSGAQAEVLPVHDSPKPPDTRVSLGLDSIRRAREVWIVAAGEAKADAVGRALAGDRDVPAAVVSGTERTLWLIDAAASTRI
ncbi:6-phosphogluconolactonase [Demequina sp. TTPB684]|uniref:6-phosphogluconolactonase n=1 Tax=unclassified Demequina TaxID=2620311 RepID=UPI001CF176EB|nr:MULTISPECIES: 6-phosphogluconolactonase [unclassified Demequina]MCB2411645.1 6-phosphogluconolactonase [Demequina sp. TTPB684]UPU89339.1 6-phosphogluconolactonase [Demequina sp. TMPB413]